MVAAFLAVACVADVVVISHLCYCGKRVINESDEENVGDQRHAEDRTLERIIRNADSKGRVALPGFANATVVISRVNETEFRVQKAKVIPEKDLEFHEENLPLKLSKRDTLAFLASLENPPPPNARARRAAKKFMKNNG